MNYKGGRAKLLRMTFDKGLNSNIGHDGSLRLMVTDFSQLGYHLLQVLSASFAICKALGGATLSRESHQYQRRLTTGN